MPNIQNLNLLYDSASVLSAGVVSIDLECNATTNKVLSSVIIDKNTFVEVPKVLGSNHIYVTKIVNCDNSYYYVSETYGVVSDKMTTKCPACEFEPNLQVSVDLQPIIDKLDEIIANDDENTTNIIEAINNNNEKELKIPIAYFVESGSYDYFLASSFIGIDIINSVEIGEDLNTLNAISNYTISPNGDLTINSNVQLTSEIVRITGQK